MKAFINGKAVEYKNNDTILEVARENGHFIPTLCEMKELCHTPATCRVCLVGIKRKGEDTIRVVTSCNTPMEDDIEIFTRTKEIREKQRLQVELLLADHDNDCASCMRHGNCELQDVAQFVGLEQARYNDSSFYKDRTIDRSSVSIVRDMTKCIRCFRCVSVCRNVQGTDALVIAESGLRNEVGVRDGLALGSSECVSCGQCTLVCPVGALSEKDDTEKVIDYLYDPDVFTVFQFAPATRIALGEEFNMPPGSNVQGQMVTALKTLGADIVLDTNFSADLVIMEEGTELLNRVNKGGTLPLITSCSPGWVNYIEKNYPEFLDNVSTTRSPQQCLGVIAKTYLAEKEEIDPKKMRVVSIMPCTAKKGEAVRPEFTMDGNPDVDVVLTTREFARLIKREGIDLPQLEESKFDNKWMGDFTGAAEIFGTTGGVMEAAVRTVHYVVTGKELPGVKLEAVRGLENIKEASLELGNLGEVKVAVAHGLKAAKEIMERMKSGTADYHFIEIMCCPGGCMSGGGQPKNKKSYQGTQDQRHASIYAIDEKMELRQSHNNPMIKRLYEDFLGEPNSEKAHHLLHTHYTDRKVNVKHSIKDIWEEIQVKN